VARHGDHVGGRVGALGGEQIVLLALIVRQADVDLDSRILLKLVDEFLRQKLVISGDIERLALRPRWARTDDVRKRKRACAAPEKLQGGSAARDQFAHYGSPLLQIFRLTAPFLIQGLKLGACS
jgi:hypothetical protein